MDPQQILHLINFNSSCSEEEESHTLKALLKINFQYAKATNFEISRTMCKIMVLISALKAFSHLELLNNCRASDKITTSSYWHSFKTKPSNLPIWVNDSQVESLGQICSCRRFQSCLADLHLLKFFSAYHRWVANFSKHVWSLFITINIFWHYKVGVWTPIALNRR